MIHATSTFTSSLLALLGAFYLSGCAAYLGERIVRAPNLDRPTGLFNEQMDKAWESHVARHFLVEPTRVSAPADGVELQVAVLPTGDYPNQLDFEQDEQSTSVAFRSALPVGPPRAPAKGTIVAIHGWQAEHRALLYHAMEFAREGWDVVLYDQRGHGRSGGEFVTFGAREARDLRAVIEWSRARDQFTPPLVLFGTSMGASVALLAAADVQTDAVVAIAPFARFDAALDAALGRLAPFYMRPFLTEGRIEEALIHARQLSGVAVGEVAPITRAAEVKAPVLLIHGSADQLVPVEHAHQLHENLPNATLTLIDDRSHEALLIDRETILARTLPWLASLTKQKGSSPGDSVITGDEGSRRLQ